MKTIIIDSFHIGGLERRYLSIIKYLIKSKLNSNYSFYVNKACLKNTGDIDFFKSVNCVKLYGFRSRLYKIPLLRYLEYKVQLIYSYVHFFIISRKKNSLTFFIGHKSLRFLSIVNTQERIYELVYSGKFNERIEFVDTFKKTFKYKFNFLCLTEKIYSSAINYLQNLSHINTTITFSNKSFCNLDIDNASSCNIVKSPEVSFVSRLDEGKGVELLLEIINHTLLLNNKIRFNIIGYGRKKKQILAYLSNNLSQFVGNVNLINTPNPSEFISKSLIFLSLQKFENFPSQSTLEAMFYKNYILLTNVGMSHILISNNNGEVLEPDPKLFSERIVQLISSFEETVKLGHNSHELIVKEYQIKDYINFLNIQYSILD